jgi:hypothetical protein
VLCVGLSAAKELPTMHGTKNIKLKKLNRNINVVSSETNTKHKNEIFGQNVDFFNVIIGGT